MVRSWHYAGQMALLAGCTQIALSIHCIMTTAAAAATSSLSRAVYSKTSTTGGSSSVRASNAAYLYTTVRLSCIQCFDAVGWAAGRASGLQKTWVMGWWRHGYLSGARCRLAYGPADAFYHSLSLASVKSRLVLPFWYWLTRVVPDYGPLNVR